MGGEQFRGHPVPPNPWGRGRKHTSGEAVGACRTWDAELQSPARTSARTSAWLPYLRLFYRFLVTAPNF